MPAAGPRRAAGIVLCGRLRESGFQASQWLVLRDSQYLQLPEPLYRLLEDANGRRSPAELAARLSKTIGMTVRVETVQALVLQRLAPLGLIAAPAAAEAPAPSAAAVPAIGRAPLSLSVKCRMVSPRLIDPCTAVLQLFYWPPLLIIALVAAALLLRWLFFAHGLGASLATALTNPTHLLVVLGLTLVGGAFHELGHAAALRYGGGRVRGMGVGIYLVYPAFYTDVSENYRLGRWARVRTDLGGFYFNLLFGLGIGGLYALTGTEYLLLAIVLLVLDIIRQSLPFVRMDGYWALADLTGIPDFFATLAPFLRSLVPAQRWPGQRLPPLHTWVRAVYALYLLITVPLLAFVLGELLWGLPHLLLTAAGTGLRLGQEIRAAWQHAAIATLAATLVQFVLLGLPVVGLGLMLANLGRRLARALWRLSQPTPWRRAAGALVVVAIAGGLTRLWLPALHASLPRPAAAQAARAPAGVPGVPEPFARSLPAQPDAATLAGPLQPRGAATDAAGDPWPEGIWQALPDDGGSGPPRAAVVIAGSPARSISLHPDGSYCVQPLSGAPRCGHYEIVNEAPANADVGPSLTTAGRTLTVLGTDGSLLRLQPNSPADAPQP